MIEVCCFITFMFSLCSSYILRKYETSKNKKEKKYYEFYKEFHVLFTKIHKGRALDFSDLSVEEQERIIVFLQENYNYASNFLQKLIYELVTSYENNEEGCNFCYRSIIEYMITKENKHRKKYNNINY